MFELFSLVSSLPLGLFGFALKHFVGIAIGLTIGISGTLFFAALYLNHNFKTRPQWCLDKLAKYANRYQPYADWATRYAEMWKKAATDVRNAAK